ncbi:MAG: hypothetical protein R3F11_25030 [Verrucomicrobiales bacterium]
MLGAGGGYWLGNRKRPDPPPAQVSPPASILPPAGSAKEPDAPVADEDQPAEAETGAATIAEGGRIASLARLIGEVEASSADALWAQHQTLKRADRSGSENEIERKIILYRLGELEGPDAVRKTFHSDANRAEYEHATVLEGWAHRDPEAALEWWGSLPDGRLRQSLLAPMVQGYLSGSGSGFGQILGRLKAPEFGTYGARIIRHALEVEGITPTLDLYIAHFGNADWNARNRASLHLNAAICQSSDPAPIRRWLIYGAQNGWAVSSKAQKDLIRAAGAAGGAEAFGWLVEAKTPQNTNLDNQSKRLCVALGWVRADLAAAADWAKANPSAKGDIETAFQLAVANAKSDPAQAREWSKLVTDAKLAATLGEILGRYEVPPEAGGQSPTPNP